MLLHLLLELSYEEKELLRNMANQTLNNNLYGYVKVCYDSER